MRLVSGVRHQKFRHVIDNHVINSCTAIRVWAGTIKLMLVLFEKVRTHGGYQISRTNLKFSHGGNCFSRALTGFVSCDGINFVAKMLVVFKIIVIQNGPSTHVIDATSFVQKQC
jgi:hypothetical protein